MSNLKPNKYYYIKHKYPERTIDRKLEKGWAGSYSYDVAEVLCDVPTYEELCIERKLIMDLSEENAQLKDLLKEWVQFEIEENPNDFTVMSERMSELANKTKEVLK